MILLSLNIRVRAAEKVFEADICIYGGTSAGVIAAVQAAKMGATVALIEPGKHLGGMTASGLGAVDVGRLGSIGGLTRDYFHRIWQYYQDDKVWKYEPRRVITGQHPKLPPTEETMWMLEPHVGELIFEQLVANSKIKIFRSERLNRKSGVIKSGAKIIEIATESGKKFRAKMFLDATYEGDLMATAGVAYTVGREANSLYGETLNGLRRPESVLGTNGTIDPFLKPGDPASGLLPRVRPTTTAAIGSADDNVQAYCYRMSLTEVPQNRVMISKPTDYDEKNYEIIFRAIETGRATTNLFCTLTLMPNRKTDSNNRGSISTDFVGMSREYVEADYAAREKIAHAHESWQRGLLWTLQNHPRVPAEMRKFYSTWGLAKDEFTDNHHWPHQLYVREARRMLGEYVMTEKNCASERLVTDSVGMGSYMMDSHLIQYLVGADGTLKAEGGMGSHFRQPYPISYHSLTPKISECENLLVPICFSSSHAAYGSLRMEPVFMILGQSAATAAVLAIHDGIAVQQLDYTKLRAQLLLDQQRLEMPAIASTSTDTNVIEIDDTKATLTGNWHTSTTQQPFIGIGYLHDSNEAKGKNAVRFTPDLPADGRYEVYLYWLKHANRATNVPVTVTDANGVHKLTINQHEQGGWVKIFTGQFTAGKNGNCRISTEGTDGFVVVDAVRWVAVGN